MYFSCDLEKCPHWKILSFPEVLNREWQKSSTCEYWRNKRTFLFRKLKLKILLWRQHDLIFLLFSFQSPISQHFLKEWNNNIANTSHGDTIRNKKKRTQRSVHVLECWNCTNCRNGGIGRWDMDWKICWKCATSLSKKLYRGHGIEIFHELEKQVRYDCTTLQSDVSSITYCTYICTDSNDYTRWLLTSIILKKLFGKLYWHKKEREPYRLFNAFMTMKFICFTA